MNDLFHTLVKWQPVGLRADERPGSPKERPLDAIIPVFAAQTKYLWTRPRPKDALSDCRVVHRPAEAVTKPLPYAGRQQINSR